MKVSKVAAANARRLFRLCQAEGRLDETRVRSAVAKLVAQKPRGYRAILFCLKRLVRLEMERRHVVVESAAQLDEAARARVAAGLAAKYGSDLTMEYRVTPDLIGGLRVRVGNDVWDGTVKGRLDRFANAF
jgi:F-type H+-transporting ATPase subunit delta